MKHPDKLREGGATGLACRSSAIDALRGLACLWIVAFHAWGVGLLSLSAPHPLLQCYAEAVNRVVSVGYVVAPLFLVLSGYCLFAPMVGADGTVTSPTWGAFFRRRAVRILPAYYAALGLAWLVPFLCRAAVPESAVPHGANDLWMHLLLIHDLSRDTATSFGGCFWWIAIEVQLCLLLPILAFLVRRIGIRPVVLAALAVSLAWRVAEPHMAGIAESDWTGAYLIYTAPPGLLFAFVAGMAAAVAVRRSGAVDPGRSAATVLLWLLPLTLLITLAAGGDNSPLTALLWSIVFACIVTFLESGRRPLIVRAPGGFARVGAISYSLYLTHQPILWLLVAVVAPKTRLDHSLLLLVAGVPAVLLVGALFHAVVERPSLLAASRCRVAVRARSAAAAPDAMPLPGRRIGKTMRASAVPSPVATAAAAAAETAAPERPTVAGPEIAPPLLGIGASAGPLRLPIQTPTAVANSACVSGSALFVGGPGEIGAR